jgi:hypothetical protein
MTTTASTTLGVNTAVHNQNNLPEKKASIVDSEPSHKKSDKQTGKMLGSSGSLLHPPKRKSHESVAADVKSSQPSSSPPSPPTASILLDPVSCSPGADYNAIADFFVREAIRKGATDNVTLAIVFFEPNDASRLAAVNASIAKMEGK